MQFICHLKSNQAYKDICLKTEHWIYIILYEFHIYTLNHITEIWILVHQAYSVISEQSCQSLLLLYCGMLEITSKTCVANNHKVKPQMSVSQPSPKQVDHVNDVRNIFHWFLFSHYNNNMVFFLNAVHSMRISFKKKSF